ncbi:SH3 domain-containing protein [Spongisporangium articulatum]|uniref:SH3 domain-containing protein n=1 Tax=Spongisporangium articulatum TaxID=3362603 RepID=A0ABW8ASF1_9ACTN
MASGRHREETTEARLSGLPRLLGSLRRVPWPVAAIAGLSVLLVALGVAVWPGGGAEPQAVPGPQSSVLADSAALRDRAAERVNRSQDRTPLPTPALPAVKRKLWVTTAVNVRYGPSAGTKRFELLKALQRVGVTGTTSDGWTEVVVDEQVGWVKSGYLSKKKPKPEPTSTGVSGASCPISPDVETHLTANARAVYRAVCAAYGDSVSSFGGYRAGDSGDHGSGRAVDIMVSGEPGRTIARYVQAHAGQLHVSYVIYQQKIWMAGHATGDWEPMEDRGSATANHYDHVHVSVE